MAPGRVGRSFVTVRCARASIRVREKISRNRPAAFGSPWMVTAPVSTAADADSVPAAICRQVSSSVVQVTAGSPARPSRSSIEPSSTVK